MSHLGFPFIGVVLPANCNWTATRSQPRSHTTRRSYGVFLWGRGTRQLRNARELTLYFANPRTAPLVGSPVRPPVSREPTGAQRSRATTRLSQGKFAAAAPAFRHR